MDVARLTSKLFERRKLTILRRLHTACDRKQVEIAIPISEGKSLDSEYEGAKPFASIPGPKPIPFWSKGNMWRLTKFGTYGGMDKVDLHKRLYEEYGPIVSFQGVGHFSVVFLFEPEDAEKMFRYDGNLPHRLVFPSLLYYRQKVRKDIYGDHLGLLISNGEAWQKFRTASNQALMKPKNVLLHLDGVDAVCDDFLERIRYIRKPDNELPQDFMHELKKLTLETFGHITLDTRFGCLRSDLSPDSEVHKMIQCTTEANDLVHILDFKISFWEWFSTPNWKKFVNANNFIIDYTMKHINAKWEKIKGETATDDDRGQSVLETLLHHSKDPRIPVIVASDTLFAGLDSTSITLATTLSYLSMFPEKQEKLFQELKQLLPKKDSKVTPDVLENLKYTRAAIKESMRLNPVIAVGQRKAWKNLVFQGYQIPKGTTLLVSNITMCRLEKHFKNAMEFMPERWLRESECPAHLSAKATHPFVCQPFGFGPRACVGQRFAYLEMDVALAKMIRNFKVTYDHGPMTWSTKLFRAPDKPLNFKMTERPE